MKFTLNWLKEHLETSASAQEVANVLTDIGLEVESITDPEDEYGAFRICRVTEARRHPNADKLQVCQVETYPDFGQPPKMAEVVCGAPNARAGLIGVFAPVGTRIPGTGLDLKKGRIRGVESNGMLCSERELNVSDEHDGIIDLPEDAPLGAKFIDYFGLNDPAIEIAVTPNRPDALGIRGIARDLAARGIGVLKQSPVGEVKGGFPCPVAIQIEEDAAGRPCPAFFGRVIRNVNNGPSPDWLQNRLKAIGLRPISALVDVTNFVTYDRNRPLHVFDADKISGDLLRIHMAKGGESITALDGAEYEFEPGMIVISDENGPESIAGIMGGSASGVSAETHNVFLESALWDPIITASSGRKLKINSDARYRFERGVDPEFAMAGLDLGTRMIIECCGGEASAMGHDGSVPKTARTYQLRTSRVQGLVGMDVPVEEQLRVLDALGFRPQLSGDVITASVPSWRPDIFGEADLVEEVARIVSLADLKGVPLPRVGTGVPSAILTPIQKRERAARRTIASLGYDECVTYSFVDASLASLFSDAGDPVRLENPISTAMDVMRPELLAGLLQAAARNMARGFNDLALFEVGPVFNGAAPGQQLLQASGLLVGKSSPKEPHGRSRAVDIYDVKADAEAVLAAIGSPPRLRHSRDVPGWWHPGRSGSIFVRPGHPLAYFGELHPKVLRNAGIKGTAVAFSVFVERPPYPRSRSVARPALVASDLQAVERDFAFVVDDQIEAEAVIGAVMGSTHRKVFESVRIFDEFRGPKAESQFGSGKKSLAVNVRMRPSDSSFKDEQIDAIGADIVRRVKQRVGGQLRQ